MLMYRLNKKHQEIYMKVRKTIFSCTTLHQLDVAEEFIRLFRKDVEAQTLKIDFYHVQVESACHALNRYLNKRRDEIRYVVDDFRKPPHFASEVLIP